MENSGNILDELREISPSLAEIKNVNIYSVNPAYFNNLAENIFQKINLANQTFNFSPVTPYTVKEGYFDNFSQNVLQKIRQQQQTFNEVSEELNDIAPLLNTISKTNLFSVPADFFEKFQITPTSSINPKAKVINIARKYTRYAVAAVVATVMIVGFYLITGKEQKKSGAQAVNVQSAIKNLRDEEIIEFLRTHSSRRNTTTVSSEKNTAPEINESLKQMTEEEIQQYLQETPEPAEIEADI